MMQLRGPGYAALGKLVSEPSFPPKYETMEELETKADEYHRRFLAERSRAARKMGISDQAVDAFDQLLRPRRNEFLDDPSFPADKKVRMVRMLHVFNLAMGSYRRYTRLLEPIIRETAARRKRPARLLELASGSGELAFELAKRAKKKGLPVTITGSDVVPEYIPRANELAEKRNLDVSFIELNAFDMAGVKKGAFDIVMISQSIHHFTAGQLAMMIAQSQKIATTAFVGFDGYRGPMLASWLPLATSLSLRPYMVHDALLSGLKAYSECELELIARMAAPPGAMLRQIVISRGFGLDCSL